MRGDSGRSIGRRAPGSVAHCIWHKVAPQAASLGSTVRLMARTSHPVPYLTVLAAGLCGGVLDLVFALVFYGLRGTSPGHLLQGIAFGLLGRQSFQLGAASIALGLFVHFFASVCAATVYYLASRRFTLLIRRPLLSGSVFGVGMYLTMRLVVMPMSRIGFQVPSAASAIGELCSHIFLFGFSIALIIAHAKSPAATIGVPTAQAD